MSAQPPDSFSRGLQQEAAAWVFRLQAGLEPEEETLYRAWLGADPRHASAVAELTAAWETVALPRRSGQAGVALARLGRRQARRRSRRAVAAAGAGALVLALLLCLRPARTPPEPSAPGLPDVALHPNVQVLPDGSRVELNAGAQIAVHFLPAERRVSLVRGEALFKVAKNHTRPFIVSAGGVEVRAVGTAFSVDYEERQVDVVVTEGRVAVRANDRPTLVAAGHRAILPFGPTAPRAPVAVAALNGREMAAALAWRGARVEFTRAPLSEVVTYFDRQNSVQLLVGDPEAGGMRLSGVVWANDPEGLVRLLESGFDVRAQRDGAHIVLRRQ